MESEGTHSDPNPDWDSGHGPETGLEEPMWQLGMEEPSSYPERPGEPDCIYYLRTGFCGYADRCRFNHPRDRSTSPVVRSGRVSGGGLPERAGQPICQYFMRTGSCKFGSSCKYHHPRQGASSVNPFALNIYGYPLRPGEKECTYYIKTGQCKFGMTCKFHHPPPSNVPVPTAAPATVPPALASPTVYSTPGPTPQQYGVMTSNWPVARPSMVPGSYIQGLYGPMLISPGIVPFPSWGPYPGTTPITAPNTQSVGAGQFYGLMPMSPSAYTGVTGPYQAISPSGGGTTSISKEHSYPQRPGQPECQHYLKTGDCKFGSSCKYNHPSEWVVPETSSALSPMGLPLRPGTPTCSYYAQHGVCKFGPTCKFDHPMGNLSYSPSASSLSDMAVAPYPVGSSIGTLAPSSSSSDLRAEVISGSNKESASALSSSVSISSGSGGSVLSSGSGGSVLSKSGSISHSGIQQSSQSSTTSTGSKGGPGDGGAPS